MQIFIKILKSSEEKNVEGLLNANKKFIGKPFIICKYQN